MPSTFSAALRALTALDLRFGDDFRPGDDAVLDGNTRVFPFWLRGTEFRLHWPGGASSAFRLFGPYGMVEAFDPNDLLSGLTEVCDRFTR